MGFVDLKSPGGLKNLNDFLATRSYIEGYQPSQADVLYLKLYPVYVLEIFPMPCDGLITLNPMIMKNRNYPDRKKALNAYGDAEPAVADEDDIDLFGSDDENEEEAEKLRQERLAAYEEKKKKKPALIVKSSLVLDFKPWDDETNMDEMEKKVCSIQADGLVWGASKSVPVGYGICKLQISCVVEDDKFGTDFLDEAITAFEDLVQSVDVAAFNKI